MSKALVASVSGGLRFGGRPFFTSIAVHPPREIGSEEGIDWTVDEWYIL